MDKMKVAHIVEPFSSGIITSIIHLSTGLTQHEHIVIHGTRTSQDNIDSVKSRFPDRTIFYVWKSAVREISPLKDLMAAISLFNILLRIKPDVVHLHSSKAGAIGRPIARILGIKKIIYSPQGAPFARKDVSKLTHWLYVKFEQILNAISGRIVCCCESETSLYQKSNMKATYVNNGIEITHRNRISSNHSIIRIGCAALANTQKNPSWFNEIASNYINYKEIEFIWIGGGELSNTLSAPNIKVTGWESKKETSILLSSLDIYLSTSGWEGLPFSVLEAMEKGVCLLLSDCVGNKDLVIDNKNGFLFTTTQEAIEKLDDLVMNKSVIAQMGQKSRELCSKKFNATLMCEQFDKLYNEI